MMMSETAHSRLGLVYRIRLFLIIITWVYSITGAKLISKKNATPNPPITRLGYTTSLLFAISDTQPNPTRITRSMVTKSYASMIFEYWEIVITDCSYNFCSVYALSAKFASESVNDLPHRERWNRFECTYL